MSRTSDVSGSSGGPSGVRVSLGNTGHAVVIGGSMAGLLTARVLANHFEQVTLGPLASTRRPMRMASPTSLAACAIRSSPPRSPLPSPSPRSAATAARPTGYGTTSACAAGRSGWSCSATRSVRAARSTARA